MMTERPSLKRKLKEQFVYWAYAFAVGHGAAGLAIGVGNRPPFPGTVQRGPSEPHTRVPITVFHGRDALPEARMT